MDYELEFEELDYDDIKLRRGAAQTVTYKQLFGRIPPSMPVRSSVDTEEDVIRELAGRVAEQ